MRSLVLILAGIVASGCVASKPESGAVQAQESLAAARPLDVPPAAVQVPEAPGLNVEDLGARLRDAVGRTSGVDVVDEASVRRELASCTEAPCPDALAEKYRAAAFVVASSVSRIGDVFLATVRVQRGAEELARTSAQASDARRALEGAGHEAGAKLRARLIEQGASERVENNEKDEAP